MQPRIALESRGSHNKAPSPATSFMGDMWLVMTGSPTICASKMGMPNPSRVEAKEQKVTGGIGFLHFSVGQFGLRGVFNSQLLQHAMICVRWLSDDAKMNIKPCSASACRRKFLFSATPMCKAMGLGLLGSAFRGLKCCGTTVGMTVIF